MKLLSTGVISIAVVSICHSAIAQDAMNSSIMTVSPDELTDILVGKAEVDRNVRALRLSPPRSEYDMESTSEPIPDQIRSSRTEPTIEGNLKRVELSEEESETLASMFYFMMIDRQVQMLGYENMVEIISSQPGVAEDDASQFISYSQARLADYHLQINSRQKLICQDFYHDLDLLGIVEAVESAAWAQSELEGLPILYFANSISEVTSLFPEPLSDDMKSKVSEIRGGLVQYSYDPIHLFSSSSFDPLSYYSKKCDFVLSP